MNQHEFYQIVNEQGQHRFSSETFVEFEKRVMDVFSKRQKNIGEWRKDNHNTAMRRKK